MGSLANLAYLVLLVGVSPWLVYRAVFTGRYRHGWREKLLGLVPLRQSSRPCAVFHAVSVGEINALSTILLEFERRHPDWDRVVTTTTESGMELAKKKYPRHLVTYYPLDFTWSVRNFLRRLRPNLIVLLELELWPNLIRIADQQGVKLAVVNGRLSEKSFRGYQRIRFIARRVAKRLHLVAAQSEEYAERFRLLGVPAERVLLTGNVKFDGALTDRQNPRTQALGELIGMAPGETIFLAGSTQHPEESLALDCYRELVGKYPGLRLIIVPRHPERFDSVARLIEAAGVPWARRSRLSLPGEGKSANVVLVDTVGELGAWWGLAQIAFVGGSLGTRGGQNMIEPSAYGAAVCFGPRTVNFRDVVSLLLKDDAGVVVENREQLVDFVRKGLAVPAEARKRGERARQLVIAQQGATKRTCEELDRLIQNSELTGPHFAAQASGSRAAKSTSSTPARRGER